MGSTVVAELRIQAAPAVAKLMTGAPAGASTFFGNDTGHGEISPR